VAARTIFGLNSDRLLPPFTLIILNDPPYGTERSYNGLRLALALTKTEGTELRIFVMADAVACAKAGQKTPEGYYNLERMLRGLAAKEVPVGACGTCMDARGMIDADLVAGAHRSSMTELAEWTLWAEKVVTF
jgi:uncharacterized protein involved in oxidation of intracellular sulfur